MELQGQITLNGSSGNPTNFPKVMVYTIAVSGQSIFATTQAESFFPLTSAAAGWQ